MNEVTSRKKQAAESFMRDDALNEAVATLLDKYHNQIESSLPEESAERERAYSMIRAIRDIENEIGRMISGAKLAEHRERISLKQDAQQ